MIAYNPVAHASRAETGCRSAPLFTCADQRLFEQIRQYAQYVRSARIWNGHFDLQKMPLYLVHRSGQRADRGFLLHVPVPVSGATPIFPPTAAGPPIYRYDKALRTAEKTDNGLFDFNFPIQGTPYFMMLYTDFDEPPTDIHATSREEWLRILVHESFHVYQFDWIYPEYGEQEEAAYPLTPQILSLSLLELTIANTALETRDPRRSETLLNMFVAVRHEKILRDPSGRDIIHNMDNVQEYLEGTAKYVEVQTAEHFHPGFSREHYAFELDEPLSSGFQSQDQMRDFFTFGLWYFTGSLVLQMMDRANIAFVEPMEQGQTPYAIAAARFRHTPEERTAHLMRAKREFNYPALEKKAAQFLTLD